MWNDTKQTLMRSSTGDTTFTELISHEHTDAAAVPPEAASDQKAAGPDTRRLEQLFQQGSPQFMAELESLRDPAIAAALADRWAGDSRPWARMQLLAYLEGPLRFPGHQPLIKRLYRAAERHGDLELIGAFLVAFDRLVTHARRSAAGGDIRLSALQNVIPSFRRRKPDDTWHDHRSKVPLPHRGRLFSYRTRYYLRRRAWRAIRRSAARHPDQYPNVAAALLARYTDEDLATGERVLDRWGLLQIAFKHHPALSFGRHTVQLRPGQRMGNLSPAPSFLPLWQMPTAGDALLRLMVEGKSHLVRRWAHQLLLAEHGPRLRTLSPLCWLPLLDHARPEIAAFAFEGLQASATLATLPIEECLPLLETKHRAARQFVRQGMINRINRGELLPPDLITLCCQTNRDVVAAAWAKLKPATAEGTASSLSEPDTAATQAALDVSLLSRLASVRCRRYAGAIAALAVNELAKHCHHPSENTATAQTSILAFFDHPLRDVRRVACQWWVAKRIEDCEPELWIRLCAVHHADVQKALLAWLGRFVGDSLLGRARHIPDELLPGAWILWNAVLNRPDAAVRALEAAIDQAAAAIIQHIAAEAKNDTAPHATDQQPAAPFVAEVVPRLAGWARDGRSSVAGRALTALVQIAAANETARQQVTAALPALRLD